VLIPDRPVNAIAKPGGGGGGGGTKQIIPAGVTRIGGVQSGGTDVGVAVIDTGLDLGHADFKRPTGDSAIAPRCFDAYGGNCMDQNGHGTHIGGIVAAQNNGIDVVGVAPNVTLYAVRVLDSSGSGYDTDIMAGLDWIWNENGGDTGSSLKISVGNMSFGRAGKTDDNPALLMAVQRLTTGGVDGAGKVFAGQRVTLVAAAGNDPRLQINQQVPAAYSEVLAIASTTALNGNNACNRLSGAIAADTASYFTTDGAGVAISAPGEDQENVSRGCLVSSVGILSLKLGGGTVRMSGTSMAAPHAAAAAALIYGQGPTDPNTVRTKLKSCASGAGVAPLKSPTSSYTDDGVREGVVSVSCL
jgi:subtilisin